MNYITSVNNTIHIGLYNEKNILCANVTCLQRLHCSQTLNKIVNKLNTNKLNKFQRIIIEPLKIYSNITIDNCYEIFKNIQKYYEKLVNSYLSDNTLKGYSPLLLLMYSYIPTICNVINDEKIIEKIITELNVDLINFNTLQYAVKDIIYNNPYYIDELIPLQFNEYINCIPIMRKINKINTMRNFVSTILEFQPDSSVLDGHALILIKSNDNNFYIIDDSNSITEVYEYFKKREHRMHAITMRDINNDTVNELNKIFSKFQKDKVILNRCNRVEIVFKQPINNFVGGSSNDKFSSSRINETQLLTQTLRQPLTQYISQFTLCFIIVSIIILIIVSMISKKRLILSNFENNGREQIKQIIRTSW